MREPELSVYTLARVNDLGVTRFDYDVSNNLIYLGEAPWGSATSDAVWTVTKFTYDGSNNVILKQHSMNGKIWDNRASLTYG